jgi:hypothetical protein
MSRDVMKLALEALEWEEAQTAYPSRMMTNAVTALREALAEQPAQQEPVAWGVDWGKAGDIPCVSIIKRLPGGGIEVMAVEYAPYSYTSPPAQQEPVAWYRDEDGIRIYYESKVWDDATPLYTSPPARHGWTTEQIAGMARLKKAQDKKLSQRTWVGLTDEEIEDIWADCPVDWDDKINILTFARAIEAAHGIKENT